MKILVIDNSIEPPFEGANDLRRAVGAAAPGSVITTRRGPEEDLPDPQKFDRIIASGSLTSVNDLHPWTIKLEEMIRRAIDLGKPYFGICFGHQILARALGGNSFVRRAEAPELGWTEIRIGTASRLAAGLPERFYSFSSHYDEVCQVPSGFKACASSKDCGIQILESTDRPIFGIQFHPEKNLVETEASMSEYVKTGRKKWVSGLNQGKRLYDPKVCETLFRNFIQS